MNPRRIFAVPAVLASSTALAVLATSAAHAQLLPLGERFEVNTYSTGSQLIPDVAATGDGRFVVVWQGAPGPGDSDYTSISAHRFDADGNPAGEQTLVNAFSTGDQDVAAVGVAGDGGYVVTWTHRGLRIPGGPKDAEVGRRFAADGAPQGGNFAVSSYATGDQRYARVGVADDGDFVVAWRSDGSRGTDQSGASIQARRFDSGGGALGDQFQVNTDTSASEGSPDISVAPDGSFVVVWHVSGGTAAGHDIRARRFDLDGDPIGGELAVNSYTTGVQQRPMVDSASDGGFVVTWFSTNSPGDDQGFGAAILARRYASGGTPAGTDFQVNVYTYGFQMYPDVAVGAGGSFLIVWAGETDTGGGDIFALAGRLFDAGGEPLGGDVGIDVDLSSSPERPRVAADDLGRFVVAWHGRGGGGSDDDGEAITARRFCIDADEDQQCDDTGAVPVCGEASEVAGNLGAGVVESRVITASDALIVLRTAVGVAQCPPCVCDVNDSGGITATDALIVLRFAVGQSIALDCPPCT